MQLHPWILRVIVATVIAGAGAAQAGVHVALVPSSAQIAPGTEFEVRLRVTQEGDAFNAYSTVLSFDPAALTFIPMPAATQEGAYMALACGSSSHSCIPSTGQLSISHTLLCLGLSLTGPGDLYVLRFRAANVPQTSVLHFSSVQFYYAGRFATISEALDAGIQIGSPVDAGAGPGTDGLELHASPNPFFSTTVLRAVAHAPLASAVVYDARGRVVRSLALPPLHAGQATFQWNGEDNAGARVRSGVYWIVLTSGTHRSSTRVVRLD